jgi:hypothetical protein
MTADLQTTTDDTDFCFFLEPQIDADSEWRGARSVARGRELGRVEVQA